ncbi:hypothetical protein RB213_004915, partial [Colletotrichum asianum]
ERSYLPGIVTIGTGCIATSQSRRQSKEICFYGCDAADRESRGEGDRRPEFQWIAWQWAAGSGQTSRYVVLVLAADSGCCKLPILFLLE